MSSEDKTNLQIYKEIRKQVQRRYDKRKEFISHFVAYVISLVGVWVFLDVGSLGGAVPGISLFITIFWTMAVIIHGVDWVFEEFKDRAVDRELERIGILRTVYDKAKREEEPLMRLTDDGEISEDYAEDDYQHTGRIG